MTRENIIRMARKVGIDPESDTLCNYDGWADTLVDFAALVAAAEREACAQVCEGRNRDGDWFAAEIRARSINAA